MAKARSIWFLSRCERLPTVWSHCLAGWWLGAGGNTPALPYLFVGVTLIFLGGGFLESAFDTAADADPQAAAAGFDAGLGARIGWRWGLGLLTVGALVLLRLGVLAGALGLAVVLLIILYDFARRVTLISPVLEGLCRFFVYILAASVAGQGVTGWAIWCGFALAAYVAGTAYLESRRFEDGGYGAVILLLVPVFLALILDVGPFREPALLLSGVLSLWVILGLRPVFWPSDSGQRPTPRELRSGLVLVDWLAACPAASVLGVVNQVSRGISFAFIALFVLAVLFRRVMRGA